MHLSVSALGLGVRNGEEGHVGTAAPHLGRSATRRGIGLTATARRVAFKTEGSSPHWACGGVAHATSRTHHRQALAWTLTDQRIASSCSYEHWSVHHIKRKPINL